jgi:hypothetical protein
MTNKNGEDTQPPRFDVFRETDLQELERMISALYHEDPGAETMSFGRITATVRSYRRIRKKG